MPCVPDIAFRRQLRAGRFKEIVPFAHLRNIMTLSTSPQLNEMKLAIWRVLEDEVNRAQASEL